MTTVLQLSDKGGETGQALLVVRIEAPDDVSPDAVYARFVQVAAEAGLQATLDTFDELATATRLAKAQLGAAVVPPVQQTIPQQPAAQPWGVPPVQPMVVTYTNPPQMPAAAQQPAAAQYVRGMPGGTPCHHGMRTYIDGVTKSGPNAGKAWRAWACPAPREAQCDKEWIRD